MKLEKLLATNSFLNLTVLLVDDVKTTGVTSEECTKVIRKNLNKKAII
jgi:predicted amidophosphoribosyltransferase